MANFYDEWLTMWDKSETAKKKARKSIHEEEFEWVRTPQDHRTALLVAPETGFQTWGSETILSEIPAGWHTGRHTHGEEGIYIVEGEGFSIVKLAGEEGPGQRFDWSKGSTIWIPSGAEHQHFNTGKGVARYFSLMALHLENWLGFGKIDQLDEAAETRSLPEVPRSQSGLDARGRRIALGWDAASAHGPQGDWSRHSKIVSFMNEEQGFKNFEIQISGVMCDEPGARLGGKHAHMEAILYILAGEGYTIADGERVDWKKGTCLHVQGPQTVHEHFCTGNETAMMLRCAPGIRMNFAHYCSLERFPYLRFTREGELLHEIREVNLGESHRRLGA